MKSSAVIGLGAVSCFGQTVDGFADAIFAGRCGIGDITDMVPPTISVRIGAPVRDFDPQAHFDARTLLQVDRFTQYATVAAREATAEAGLAALGVQPGRIGVITGTANSGIDAIGMVYRRIWVDKGRPQPMSVPMIMGNAPASRIAHETGARGPAMGISSACASAAQAILMGHRMIQTGMADVMIVGGADSCFSEGYLAAWSVLKVLDIEPCRPFSGDRRGVSLGEGAAILVLASEEVAARSGARVRARLLGGGMTSDAGSMLGCDRAGMAEAMRLALGDAGLSPRDVTYVNAHGTATLANDREESAAIREVFGEGRPDFRISSTKSMIGHAMGASGALEAVATVLALERQEAPPTAGHRVVDPECGLDVTPGTAVPHEMRHAVSNSFAFGGLNASLVLGTA